VNEGAVEQSRSVTPLSVRIGIRIVGPSKTFHAS